MLNVRLLLFNQNPHCESSNVLYEADETLEDKDSQLVLRAAVMKPEREVICCFCSFTFHLSSDELERLLN